MPEVRPHSDHRGIERPHDIRRAGLACRRVEAADLKSRHGCETSKPGVPLKWFELCDASIRSHPGKASFESPGQGAFAGRRRARSRHRSGCAILTQPSPEISGNDLLRSALNQRRSPRHRLPQRPQRSPALGPLFLRELVSARAIPGCEMSRLTDITGLS